MFSSVEVVLSQHAMQQVITAGGYQGLDHNGDIVDIWLRPGGEWNAAHVAISLVVAHQVSLETQLCLFNSPTNLYVLE